jgi:hypothetical protein
MKNDPESKWKKLLFPHQKEVFAQPPAVLDSRTFELVQYDFERRESKVVEQGLPPEEAKARIAELRKTRQGGDSVVHCVREER